eukprot:CAMPEP_0185720576 /NCGR_PEP_ID=MMETSP1164-20130828/50184_1 /TAXON_ID=1104430 /ORGANISM="Chrysoreinhardia sp, Strain CCMP2950" /LENGTH=729 /DNA_ID=CAMNT_0028388239 /DNA_START=9 /DNA_END=2197 /DNA_ORIENTATION=+
MAKSQGKATHLGVLHNYYPALSSKHTFYFDIELVLIMPSDMGVRITSMSQMSEAGLTFTVPPHGRDAIMFTLAYPDEFTGPLPGTNSEWDWYRDAHGICRTVKCAKHRNSEMRKAQEQSPDASGTFCRTSSATKRNSHQSSRWPTSRHTCPCNPTRAKSKGRVLWEQEEGQSSSSGSQPDMRQYLRAAQVLIQHLGHDGAPSLVQLDQDSTTTRRKVPLRNGSVPSQHNSCTLGHLRETSTLPAEVIAFVAQDSGTQDLAQRTCPLAKDLGNTADLTCNIRMNEANVPRADIIFVSPHQNTIASHVIQHSAPGVVICAPPSSSTKGTAAEGSRTILGHLKANGYEVQTHQINAADCGDTVEAIREFLVARAPCTQPLTIRMPHKPSQRHQPISALLDPTRSIEDRLWVKDVYITPCQHQNTTTRTRLTGHVHAMEETLLCTEHAYMTSTGHLCPQRRMYSSQTLVATVAPNLDSVRSHTKHRRPPGRDPLHGTRVYDINGTALPSATNVLIADTRCQRGPQSQIRRLTINERCKLLSLPQVACQFLNELASSGPTGEQQALRYIAECTPTAMAHTVLQCVTKHMMEHPTQYTIMPQALMNDLDVALQQVECNIVDLAEDGPDDEDILSTTVTKVAPVARLRPIADHSGWPRMAQEGTREHALKTDSVKRHHDDTISMETGWNSGSRRILTMHSNWDLAIHVTKKSAYAAHVMMLEQTTPVTPPDPTPGP